MTKLQKLALMRVTALLEEASNNLNNLASTETKTKQPALGEFARIDSPYYAGVYAKLDEADQWIEAIIG